MFIKADTGCFFDPTKASLIEVDTNDTGPIRTYRVEYPSGQSIRVTLKHEGLMRAFSVVVPATPGTKAKRWAVTRVDLEGQYHSSAGLEGVFPVIGWLIRPDLPDPEPVLLLDDETRMRRRMAGLSRYRSYTAAK